MIETILFYGASAGLLFSALATVVLRSPLKSALSLIATLCFLALEFLLLDASFVAAMQVLVYAGAIMVLFVFVIMLLNLGPGAGKRPAYLSFAKLLGTLALGLIATLLLAQPGPAGSRFVDGSVKSVGTLLLTDYLFGFEAISVLLLTAAVGAVVLGLRRLT
jgi:NADH-quinone oxidoreductase subunit J